MRKIESKETRKKNRRRNILLNCAMVICAAVAVVSAGMLIASYLEYKQGDALMEGIAQYAGFTGEDTEGQEGEAAALTVDFDALLAINPDFVGWERSLTIPLCRERITTTTLRMSLTGKSINMAAFFWIRIRRQILQTPIRSSTGIA